LGDILVEQQKLRAGQPSASINNYRQYAQKEPTQITDSTLKQVSGPYDPTFLAKNPNVATKNLSEGTVNRIMASGDVQQVPVEQSWLNKNLFEGAGDVLPEGYLGTTKLEYALRNNPAEQAYFNRIKGLVANKQLSPDKAEFLIAQKLQDANINYRQYLGPLALAGIGAYAGGFFDEPEQEEFQSTFGTPVPQAKIDQYRLNLSPPPPRPEGPVQFTPYQGTSLAAHGGEMQNFPPRIGAISGPGTEKSDDVPAMLSDGEFVMTARAVRGAGNGSRRQGVKNLYDIMRNFEAVA